MCVGKWNEIGKFMVHECDPWKCGKFLHVVPKIFASCMWVEMVVGDLNNGSLQYLRIYTSCMQCWKLQMCISWHENVWCGSSACRVHHFSSCI